MVLIMGCCDVIYLLSIEVTFLYAVGFDPSVYNEYSKVV